MTKPKNTLYDNPTALACFAKMLEEAWPLYRPLLKRNEEFAELSAKNQHPDFVPPEDFMMYDVYDHLITPLEIAVATGNLSGIRASLERHKKAGRRTFQSEFHIVAESVCPEFDDTPLVYRPRTGKEPHCLTVIAVLPTHQSPEIVKRIVLQGPLTPETDTLDIPNLELLPVDVYRGADLSMISLTTQWNEEVPSGPLPATLIPLVAETAWVEYRIAGYGELSENHLGVVQIPWRLFAARTHAPKLIGLAGAFLGVLTTFEEPRQLLVPPPIVRA